MTTDSKVWFITGTSSGFGWEFADAALKRGDKVAATARKPEVLQPLIDEYGDDNVIALKLDVTDRAQVTAAVDDAIAKFGALDVVINNAGYGLQGGVEELTEKEIRDQMETNFFGLLWVTQAVLPQLRKQGGGHILNVSSIGGIAAFPGIGAYHASKWAVEALSESLSQEVASLGIKVTSVEPSGFRTKWGSANMRTAANPLPAYDEILKDNRARFDGTASDSVAGNPKSAAALILEIVDSPEPPLRLLLGNMAYDTAFSRYESRVATWKQYEAKGRATDNNDD